jgi:hypothetical protein
MATRYRDHRITAFTKVTAVYFGNLTKNINASRVKFRNCNGTSDTLRTEMVQVIRYVQKWYK